MVTSLKPKPFGLGRILLLPSINENFLNHKRIWSFSLSNWSFISFFLFCEINHHKELDLQFNFRFSSQVFEASKWGSLLVFFLFNNSLKHLWKLFFGGVSDQIFHFSNNKSLLYIYFQFCFFFLVALFDSVILIYGFNSVSINWKSQYFWGFGCNLGI